MYDTIRCLTLSGSITLFANVPQMFEWPIEKIGFGALLFFIIWTYMKQVLPKTQEESQKRSEENRKLLDEVARLNQLRDKDQKIIASLLRELKKKFGSEKLPSGIFPKPEVVQIEVDPEDDESFD